ncbi:MAG: hypothetical protein CMO77_02265 [Verrucomicrobiales bacterium]|nr:hypothetical protein [Verrucomicrobiales bacterium]MEC7882152.1 septum formation initiator family protein [Verrucomicrobiota bacterium]|tara:strand:- start:945 stop:1250 length:306 start_codon:yes stop_codon:yes gene_type:complete
MNVDTVIWDKLSRVVVVLLVLAALVWVAVLYFPLMHQNEAMRQQIIEMDQRIQHEETVNRELRLEIDSLKSDPKTVERLAREQLGLARPNETVVRFDVSGE